jgi:hypothetical protein
MITRSIQPIAMLRLIFSLSGGKIKYTNMVINGIDIGMKNGHNKNKKMVYQLGGVLCPESKQQYRLMKNYS